MGFNIPMNSKGALDASSLLSQLGGQLSNQSAQNNQMQNNGFSQPNNNFSQPNNNFSQPNNNFSQPNNNFSQPNNNFSQPNNNFSQPNNNFSQPNNNFSQPNNNFSQPNNSFSQPNNPPQNAHPAAPQGGVHLKKGQKFSIAGQNGAAIQRIRMGLGWDVTNGACDLDASAFLLDQNGRIVGDTWFVFYGQTVSPDGSVMHSGDSKGMGAGDDETIDIDLNRLSQSV